MASFNRVQAVGNVTKDPEMRYTPHGKPVTSFTLAVDSYAGEKGNRTDYIPVTVWEKTAEACVKHLMKGSLILVDGHLRQDRWEKDGSTRTRLDVVADRVVFLAKIRKAEPDAKQEAAAPEEAEPAGAEA